MKDNEVLEVAEIAENAAENAAGNGDVAKLIIIGGVVVAVVTATGVLLKKINIKDKIDQARIKKLEKHGYCVFAKTELEEMSKEEDTDEE